MSMAMRLIGAMVVVIFACPWCDTANGQQPAAAKAECPSCNGPVSVSSAVAGYYHYYGMAPGCSATCSTCCDHIWDGYCQGKALRQAKHAMRRAACCW